MSRKLMFLLFVLAFIVGFMLREMLFGISSNEKIPGKPGNFVEEILNGIKNIENKNVILEITKIETPKRVIRGNYFEMFVYIKPLKKLYTDYDLIIHLYNESSGRLRINTDKNITISTNKWQKDEIVKIGPLQVSTPDGLALGKYNIELGLIRNDAKDLEIKYENIKTNSILGSIEVVSYSSISAELE